MLVRPYTVFSTLHPALLCFYAFGAPLLTMMSFAPWFLIGSGVSAIMVHWFYMGGKVTKDVCLLCIPVIAVIAILNVITNPRGTHILLELKHRPLTLESLLYGIASGMMLAGVIVWFRCFHAILSNDKFLYLFGKRLPGTALLLSMVLKLFPETRYKMQCIRMSDDSESGKEEEGVIHRIKKGLRQLSCLLEWSMEDSIETADSMKARGYGSGKRSTYQCYKMTAFDWVTGMCLLSVLIYALFGMLFRQWQFFFYPKFVMPKGNLAGVVGAAIACLLFQLAPIWMEIIARRNGR